MSETSAAIESIAARYGIPVLEATEYFLKRVGIRAFAADTSREDAESAAIGDLETWAKLWVAMKGTK